MESFLSRVRHLGFAMSRRPSGGVGGITAYEGKIFCLKMLFNRGGVSWPRLYEENRAAAWVASFTFKLVTALTDAYSSCRRM